MNDYVFNLIRDPENRMSQTSFIILFLSRWINYLTVILNVFYKFLVV